MYNRYKLCFTDIYKLTISCFNPSTSGYFNISCWHKHTKVAVPNSQSTDWYWSMVFKEQGHTGRKILSKAHFGEACTLLPLPLCATFLCQYTCCNCFVFVMTEPTSGWGELCVYVCYQEKAPPAHTSEKAPPPTHPQEKAPQSDKTGPWDQKVWGPLH